MYLTVRVRVSRVEASEFRIACLYNEDDRVTSGIGAGAYDLEKVLVRRSKVKDAPCSFRQTVWDVESPNVEKHLNLSVWEVVGWETE